jgi:aminoglycoside/choline kinase family phosphotransferase
VIHEQPRVFVHRDYHSRNLMIVQNTYLGIIDFQGAKWGPLTYDVVSLVRDCYIDWPTTQVTQWLQIMQERLWENLKIPRVSDDCFQRWCDFTGLQRHLKAMGQFTRKYLVDQNTYYLADLPRVQNYVAQVCARYSELTEFNHLLTELTCAR